MKKAFVLLLMSSILLTSCAPNDAKEKNITNESYIESETEQETQDTASEYEYISEKIALQSYETECGKALGDIGFTKISDMSISSIEVTDDGNINETVLITDTNGKNVLLSCLYVSLVDCWTVVGIVDSETGNHYWVPEGSEKYYDMYSYETGELISPKEEDFDVDKFLDDSSKEMDKVSEGFDKSLDELSYKYN